MSCIFESKAGILVAAYMALGLGALNRLETERTCSILLDMQTAIAP